MLITYMLWLYPKFHPNVGPQSLDNLETLENKNGHGNRTFKIGQKSEFYQFWPQIVRNLYVFGHH